MLPVWVAVMEQVPVPVSVTVVPETVHTEDVADEKLTGRPDDAVALVENGAVPAATLGRGPKLMVCTFEDVMVKDLETGGAAE